MSVHMLCLDDCFATTTMPQPTKITQFIFGQPLRPLKAYGEVHPTGSWGRIMNGGAWLSLGGMKVDVLLRDLDVALFWPAQARRGSYEIDAFLGYLAGLPTYSLMAELALNRTVDGRLPIIDKYR